MTRARGLGLVVFASLLVLALAVAACARKSTPSASGEAGTAGRASPPIAAGAGSGATDAPPVVGAGGPRSDDAPQHAAPALVLVGERTAGVDAPSGVPVVRVEIAATNVERERGLMGRATLPDDRGMLFVYPRPGLRRFWMKDCEIGLDIVWIDAGGQVVDVATLPPGLGLPDAEIPEHACATPVPYVLELRAGWMRSRGLGVGARCDLARALEGVQPR